ncbi:MAG TPA: DUF2723 domain-containing protein [Candidatus Polarisedimenticolia bacterium]|jgi:hypothetical protein
MRWLPAAVVLTALVLYLVTLAPGLLWGDSAKFQRMAWEGELRFDETGHPLWVFLVHPLTRIPGLDSTRACNLSSAVLSAVALWPAFRIMRRLDASQTAAAIACLALAVSHTYWFHAVIAEVYALNSLASLLVLDLLLGAAHPETRGPLSIVPCLLLGLLFGAASGNHLLVMLWLPGLVWLGAVAMRSAGLSAAGAVSAAAGCLAGLAPFVALHAMVGMSKPLPVLIARLARQALLPERPLADLASLTGYLLYQFPLPLMLGAAVAGGARLWRERRAEAIGLALLYATTAAFAFSYQAKDRFAFYLPSYLVVAILGACGLDALLSALTPRRLRPVHAALAAGALCVAGPPIAYHLAARLAGPAIVKLGPAARNLPGRDAALYHLDPDKSGNDGARRFCEEAFAVLPREAVLLTDFTIGEPLAYLQVVETRRPDVEIFSALPRLQLKMALERHRAGREVYLAAVDSYYDIEGISRHFDIVPAGPLHHLIAR